MLLLLLENSLLVADVNFLGWELSPIILVAAGLIFGCSYMGPASMCFVVLVQILLL